MSHIPNFVLELHQLTRGLATMLHVPVATTTNQDGLYIGLRSKRDPINSNRKRKYYSVRLRRNGEEIFRSEEATTKFPSEHLVAQLMLLC